MTARREKILETGFRVFADRTIEKVTMNDVAREAGIGVATLYRYYGSKPALVLAVNTWAWQKFISERIEAADQADNTALQELDYYLESYIELYRQHKDLLRFNQFFNVYVQSDDISAEELEPFQEMIRMLADRFHTVFIKAAKDGTLHTGRSEEETFSTVTHLMLAAVTRYAVGLVYQKGTDPEEELIFLKNMILNAYRGTIE